MNTIVENSLLHVAFTSNATAQQPPLNDATGYATTTQQPLLNKPTSLLELARNKLRNNHAITSQRSMQQAPQKEGKDVARFEDIRASHREEELKRLVRLVSDHNDFRQEDYEEALETALADFNSAMICFTSLARKSDLL